MKGQEFTMHAHHLVDRMRARGWNDADVEHARSILTQNPVHPSFAKLQEILHWTVFLIVVVANFFASALILPLLAFFPNTALYAVLIIMGVCFGTLFAVILSDLNHLFSTIHHITVSLLIPTLAVVNVFLLVSYFDYKFGVVTQRSPFFMGLCYGLSFIIPYVVMTITNRK